MNADVYAKELLAAASIAGVKAEGSRECLSCVYIEFNEDGYSITPTDSFKLIHFENKHPRDYQDFSNMNAILIDAEFIKKNIKKTDSCHASHDQKEGGDQKRNVVLENKCFFLLFLFQIRNQKRNKTYDNRKRE